MLCNVTYEATPLWLIFNTGCHHKTSRNCSSSEVVLTIAASHTSQPHLPLVRSLGLNRLEVVAGSLLNYPMLGNASKIGCKSKTIYRLLSLLSSVCGENHAVGLSAE